MAGTMELVSGQRQTQTLSLGHQQLQGLRLLMKSLPELRAEVIKEIAENPAIEDTDHPLEMSMADVERERGQQGDAGERDYPEDDFVPLARRADEEAVERHQSLIERETSVETLQEHLLAQLPLSDIPESDWNTVEAIVADIDANGFYRGSFPDLCMAADGGEAKALQLLAAVTRLDPPGCGARTAGECLLAQLGDIADPLIRGQVRHLIEAHLEDIAAGRVDTVRYAEALAALRTLDPHPGRAFPSERDRVEYIHPEVKVVRGSDGKWVALTDRRSLPEVRISERFRALLADPAQSAETKEYVRGRIEAANNFRAAIEKRQETVEAIAQAIVDRQQDFFTGGYAAMKPLSEVSVAKEVGVDPSTVSRTVRDKYADTPMGTVELRRFFTVAVKNADGEEISQEAVLHKLKEIVDGEDRDKPYSDERLSEMLKAAGFPVARRTVSKYRDRLSIPAASARRG